MKQFCAVILLLYIAVPVIAQRPFSRDYWLNENHSPVKINALTQDAHGYMWLGTDVGLYRFNGRNFITIPDTAGGEITALAARGDTVFCGYATGRIALYVDGSLHTIQGWGTSPQSRINALAWHAGCLWACTDAEGIFAFINSQSYHLDTRKGLSDNYTYAISFLKSAHALVATDKGLNMLSMRADGRLNIEIADASSGIPDNIVRTVSSVPGQFPVAWAGMQDGGPLYFNFDLKEKAWPESWPWGQVNDVLPLSNNRAWIATEDGYLLDCLYSKERGFVMKPHYFPGKRFRKLLQDASGNLWCATVEGITLITDNYISYLPMGAPYTLPGITTMICNRQNNLYFAQGAALYKCPLLQPDASMKILQAKAPITSLHIDSSGRTWIGTLGAGLWCMQDKIVREIKSVPRLLSGHILDISGIGNRLWVSSLNGVEEIFLDDGRSFDPQKVVHHGKHSGIGSDYVYQLFPDSKGNMWMATDGAGICMFDGKKYLRWDSASGFLSKVVYSITEDTAGHIWAASLDNGLYEYTGERWQHKALQAGLQDLNISAVAANRSGQIVAVHSKGIDQWYPGSAQFRHYNRRLGMDIDSQSNALNCYAADTAGKLWIPFEHGLICFPNLPEEYDLQPGIVINDVLLLFRRVANATNSFGPGDNHIGFRYDGINFTNPEPLHYRYKLEGYDSAWVSTDDESVTFPRLPAGTYRFRVQSSLIPDFKEANEAMYSFNIAAPVWKRWWAITLAFVTLIAAAFLLLRLRERTLRRTAMLQRERMMAEYEQLKSQVNPHFLFNSLNTLASLIEEDEHAAVQYTMQLSDLYRSMLTFKDRDLIYLAEEWDLLQKYVHIQQSRFKGCLELHGDIPESLAKMKQIVPLALQLLVENAIKHNIVSSAQPLHIYVTSTAETITVCNAFAPKMSKAPGAGLGLANVSRRYALMSNRAVQYGIKNNDFIVILPLL